jgi:hypothetical protein
MAKCFQQIGEGLFGNVLRNDCFAKRNEYGVRRVTFIAGVELFIPPVEQFQSALCIGNLVAQIIGPAAVGVEIIEVLVQFLRQEPTGDVEIFIVVGGEPARVLLRGLRRTARRRGILRDFEFAWAQHR